MRRLRAAAAAAGALAVLAACSGPDAVALPPRPRQPTVAELTAAARLPACPAVPAAGHVRTGLPDLTLPCLGSGPPVPLSGLRGTPTVVSLWASWCQPCRREAPSFTALSARTAGRLRVLGVVTQDDRLSGLGGSESLKIRYPSVLDQRGSLLASTGHRTLPVTLFVDSGGRVVHTEVREMGSAAQLRGLVTRYLGVRA